MKRLRLTVVAFATVSVYSGDRSVKMFTSFY